MARETVTQQRDRYKARIEVLEGEVERANKLSEESLYLAKTLCRVLDLSIEATNLVVRFQQILLEIDEIADEFFEDQHD